MKPNEDYGNQLPYSPMSLIDSSSLHTALCNLSLFGDDPVLCMQAFNLAIIDQWLTDFEHELLQISAREEQTPVSQVVFLSAQSQMWIFAAYELFRTWRQRARDIIKWAESGGLAQKLVEHKKNIDPLHFGREYRALQIQAVIDNPDSLKTIKRDLKRTIILFIRLEAIRVSLAKHEIWKKSNSVALRPGQGRINPWCGSIDYELENGAYSLGMINRRDIADDIRALADNNVPSDEDIVSFKEFMRGPTDQASN